MLLKNTPLFQFCVPWKQKQALIMAHQFCNIQCTLNMDRRSEMGFSSLFSKRLYFCPEIGHLSSRDLTMSMNYKSGSSQEFPICTIILCRIWFNFFHQCCKALHLPLFPTGNDILCGSCDTFLNIQSVL